MAVIQRQAPQKSGGFLGSLLGAASMAAPFIPGMQAFAPFLQAGAALANGSGPGQALMAGLQGGGGQAIGNYIQAQQMAATKAAVAPWKYNNPDSFTGAMAEAAGQPAFDTDPFIGSINGQQQPYPDRMWARRY